MRAQAAGKASLKADLEAAGFTVNVALGPKELLHLHRRRLTARCRSALVGAVGASHIIGDDALDLEISRGGVRQVDLWKVAAKYPWGSAAQPWPLVALPDHLTRVQDMVEGKLAQNTELKGVIVVVTVPRQVVDEATDWSSFRSKTDTNLTSFGCARCGRACYTRIPEGGSVSLLERTADGGPSRGDPNISRGGSGAATCRWARSPQFFPQGLGRARSSYTSLFCSAPSARFGGAREVGIRMPQTADCSALQKCFEVNFEATVKVSPRPRWTLRASNVPLAMLDRLSLLVARIDASLSLVDHRVLRTSYDSLVADLTVEGMDLAHCPPEEMSFAGLGCRPVYVKRLPPRRPALSLSLSLSLSSSCAFPLHSDDPSAATPVSSRENLVGRSGPPIAYRSSKGNSETKNISRSAPLSTRLRFETEKRPNYNCHTVR